VLPWHNAIREAHPGARREDALLISVSRDCNIYFDEQQGSREELVPLPQPSVREDSERRVYQSVAANARCAVAKTLLEQIRLTGIENVERVTYQRRREPRHSIE
jgi:biopolymer transport protein ExbD